MSFNEHLSEFNGKPVQNYDPAKGLEDPANICYRVGLPWDDDTTKSIAPTLKKLVADPRAGEIRELVIGRMGDYGIGADDALKPILNSRKLNKIEALMFGDVVREELEVTFFSLPRGLYTLFNNYKNLRILHLRGERVILYQGIKHEKLEKLIFEVGGLHTDYFGTYLSSSDLPELKHLELWLGDKYRGDITTHALRPILEGKVFPKLEYLGLRNAAIVDELAQGLIAAGGGDDALDVKGKTCVLTGKLNNIKRADAQKQLTALGAKIGKSVSKNTHILFAGEKAGSKMDKAKGLGVAVYTEAELLEVLGITATKAVSDASGSILDRLKVLDLSLGTLTDKGAKALAENPLVKNLERLDLHHHYMSNAGIKLVEGIGVPVDVSQKLTGEAYPWLIE